MYPDMWIWQIRKVHGGDPLQIAGEARRLGIGRVYVKIADGVRRFNDPELNGLVTALRAVSVSVWGWHYVYGANPEAEARLGAERARELHLDGYVVDAEKEFKQPGAQARASRFFDELHRRAGELRVGFSAYRFPSYHPQFPWDVFLSNCHYNLPQVYWEQAHNAGLQLSQCAREFRGLRKQLPLLPVGAGYGVGAWTPTTRDWREFVETARALALPGISLYSWDYCATRLPQLWADLPTLFPTSEASSKPAPASLEQRIAALEIETARLARELARLAAG